MPNQGQAQTGLSSHREAAAWIPSAFPFVRILHYVHHRSTRLLTTRAWSLQIKRTKSAYPHQSHVKRPENRSLAHHVVLTAHHLYLWASFHSKTLLPPILQLYQNSKTPPLLRKNTLPVLENLPQNLPPREHLNPILSSAANHSEPLLCSDPVHATSLHQMR